MVFKEGELATEFRDFIECVYKDKVNGGFFTDKPELVFDNQEKDTSDITVPIIKFSCLETYKRPVTLGECRRYVRKGVITITVSVPSGSLTYDLQQLTNIISEHYEGKRVCEVNIRDINIGDISTSGGVWYSRVIIISFEYYIKK